MGKKILYIVVGALLIFGLLFVLWSWWSGSSKPAQTTGTFGTASSTEGSLGLGSQNTGNGETPLGSSASNGSVPLGSNTGEGGSLTNGGSTNGSGTSNSGSGAQFSTGGVTVESTNGATAGTASVPGVDWLGNPYDATGINSVGSGANGFTPTITTTVGSGNNGLTLGEALAGAAIAGSLSCAIQSGLAGLNLGAAAGGGAASLTLSATGVPVSDLGTHAALVSIGTFQASNTTGHNTITFIGCITNVVAKAALQQITNSVVNWINSGFNGQPAFVNNFQQFFTNVADAAAGQFIQGSGLAFLCSPFQLQIKIAIAQAYANRNAAQSCTLSKVISDVNGFMNGNFSQGGWGGLVSFTTVPTNNPYGAFAYAQAGLANAQSAALANAKNNVSPTGFLSLQQLSGCTNPAQNGIAGSASIGTNPQAAIAGGSASLPPGCKATIVTPGTAIQDSLQQVTSVQVNQLGLANDLDQIINALTTQLTTRILQNGLTSLSQTTTQTPADIAAESQATSLLTDMQNKTEYEQQLGSIYQGSISDIEQAQSQLNDLANCWGGAASSTAGTSAQQTQAAANAAAAQSQLTSLNDQINNYNDDITQVNNQIAILNQFETQVSTAQSDADVANVTAAYDAAVATEGFAAATDVTTAQQNRTTLQAEMAALNANTQTSLTQCEAYPNQS